MKPMDRRKDVRVKARIIIHRREYKKMFPYQEFNYDVVNGLIASLRMLEPLVTVEVYEIDKRRESFTTRTDKVR